MRGKVYICQVAEALKGLMHQINSPAERYTLISRAYMHDIGCRKSSRASAEQFTALVVVSASAAFAS